MPAVAALPKPDVIDRGWERYGANMDAQMRNAIYGYLAESEKQTKAAYMREVVMPGMARILKRPAYDFTQTAKPGVTQVTTDVCHRLTSRSSSATVRACLAGPSAASAWADAYVPSMTSESWSASSPGRAARPSPASVAVS